MIIADPDVLRAATLIVNEYGDEAEKIALQRSEDSFANGDADAAAIWREIAMATAQLRRGRHNGRAPD